MALFEDKIGMDIGPRTAALFANAILTAGTVVWSGPMGMCELPQFERGTREIARAAAQTHADVFVCGGATAEAISRLGFGGQLAGVCADSGGFIRVFHIAGRLKPSYWRAINRGLKRQDAGGRLEAPASFFLC
jgi:3-phosphoglycerate kinase